MYPQEIARTTQKKAFAAHLGSDARELAITGAEIIGAGVVLTAGIVLAAGELALAKLFMAEKERTRAARPGA